MRSVSLLFELKGEPGLRSVLIPWIDLGIDPKQILGNPGVHAKEFGPRTPRSETDDTRLTPVLARSPNPQWPAATSLIKVFPINSGTEHIRSDAAGLGLLTHLDTDTGGW